VWLRATIRKAGGVGRRSGWSAGVLAGWLGCVLAAELPTPRISLVTTTRASLPFGSEDAAGPAGETPALRPNAAQNAYVKCVVPELTVTHSTAKSRFTKPIDFVPAIRNSTFAVYFPGGNSNGSRNVT
jgi:hypothetical protein